MTIDPSTSGTVNLDGLERVSENLVVKDTALNGITVPDIENVGGDVRVTGNEQLNRLGLGNIATIGGDLNVNGNNALVDLTMDDLETVRGGMHLQGGFNTFVSFSFLFCIRFVGLGVANRLIDYHSTTSRLSAGSQISLQRAQQGAPG